MDVKDDGLDSVADAKGIKVRRIESVDDLDELYWWLVANPKEFKSVVIDTVTQLQGMVVDEHKPIKETSKQKDAGKKGEFGTLSKRDWGKITSRVRELVLNFRDLSYKGINVIFLAQDRVFNIGEDEVVDDASIAPEIGPSLSPSVAKTLCASVNVVANTFIRERKVKQEGKPTRFILEYCVGVGPSSLYWRKVRKPKGVKMPDAIVDCEYEDLIETMKGK